VEAFLGGKLRFTAIPEVIERTMDEQPAAAVTSLESVRELDTWAREYARQVAGGVQLKV
jgi:1-deoxy-D-xylulose-5-phosphate reductoisomerase